MKRIFYILLFLLSFLFYWNSGRHLENRAEAEDVFEYALMVEQGTDHPWFFHKHHVLFAPTMKMIFTAAQGIGYEGRAINIMRVVSALSAAGTLFFFFLFCYKRFSLRPVSSLLATAFLGLTYGFWRYSAESEIMHIATLLMVAALFFSTDDERRTRSFGLAVLFSALSVLMHLMNAIAALVAIPCYYLLKKRWRAMLLHGFLSGGLIVAVYAALDGAGLLYHAGGATLPGIGLGSGIKALVAFVECIISCDFMLGFRSVRAFLSELFAGRMLSEEFYFGARLPRWYVLCSALTFLSFILLNVGCVMRAVWVWKGMLKKRNGPLFPGGLPALAIPVLFFAGYAGLLLYFEPGNPELWVMGMMPFALIFCGLILLPLTVDNRLWLPFLMIVILLLHNAGAMRMLHDPEKDYQHQKSRVVLAHADADDLVITAGNPVFERYLRYHFEGKVVYLYTLTARQLQEADLPETSGDAYILNDVFDQPRSLRIRFPDKTDQIDEFAAKVQPGAELVEEDEFGGLYKLNR